MIVCVRVGFVALFPPEIGHNMNSRTEQEWAETIDLLPHSTRQYCAAIMEYGNNIRSQQSPPGVSALKMENHGSSTVLKAHCFLYKVETRT